MRTPEIVVIGGPNSGKTHYAGQLYGRLTRRPGALGLRRDKGTPADLSALEEVLRRLEDGCAAEHTSAITSAEVDLPLISHQGDRLNVRWPDYGGEQIKGIFDSRSVPDVWQNRLAQADGWVILIRLKSETTYPDALQELARRSDQENPKTPPSPNRERVNAWDANARWVELLQILLHVSGKAQLSRLQKPRLALLLSCYDELNAGAARPVDRLQQRLPMLSSFIHSTWAPECTSVWGLSALGRLLEKTSKDEDFIDEGPEFHGWVVPPDGGETDSDLTKPLAWLLGTP